MDKVKNAAVGAIVAIIGGMTIAGVLYAQDVLGAILVAKGLSQLYNAAK